MVQDITKSGPAVKIGATHVGGDNGSSWSQLAGENGQRVSGARRVSDSIAPQSDCAPHSTLIAPNPSTPGGKLKRQIAKLDRQQLHLDCSIPNVDIVVQF